MPMIIQEANRLQQVSEYYFSTKLAQIREMDARGLDVINLGIGNPDGKPSEETLAVLQNRKDEAGMHGYQSYRGIPELRQSMARYMQERLGASLDPEQEILPLIGSKEGIFHIAMAFLNPGDGVLVPNPGYPTYRSVCTLLGATMHEYRVEAANDWQPDIAAMEKLPLDTIKIMWLNSPHMPTGTELNNATIEALIAFAKKHQILLVHDNPYTQILNDAPKSLLSIEGAEDVMIELNSLSKSHNMPGWRIGWAAGKADYINTILKVKSNIDSGMFRLMQLAAAAALDTPQTWITEQQERYRKRRERVTEFLSTLNCRITPGQKGMFVWAQIPAEEQSGEAFAERLLQEARVFMPPGHIFGSAGEGYIRASLCVPEERIAEAHKRIEEVLA